MIRFTLLIASILFALSCYTQESYLSCTNNNIGKALLFRTMDFVYIQYDGYLDQTDGVKGYITDLDSISITVGELWGKSRLTKNILIKDITGIRRLHITAELGTSIATIGSSILTFYAIGSMAIHPALPYISSITSGLAMRAIGKKTFPTHRAKYFKSDGWKFQCFAL